MNELTGFAFPAEGPDAALSRPAAALMEPALHFSTREQPPGNQFAAWRAHCSPVVEMLAPARPDAGFAASRTAWRIGPFTLSVVSAPAGTYRRTRSQIRRDALDHWVVSVVRQGTYALSTERGGFTAGAGTPHIFSLADAFEAEQSDIDWLCLFVPRETFPELAVAIDQCRNQPIADGMGTLLADYLDGLARELPRVTWAELPRLVASTRALVAACIAPTAPAAEASAPLLQEARMDRVRQVIRQNLRSPTLTPKRICRLVGMSRSQLYRLFAPAGGVAAYIQQARLREAYRALSDPDNARDIHAVADDLGFFDHSGFSRAFRKEYGCTPSEVRRASHLLGRSEPVRAAAALAPAADSLAALLRGGIGQGG